MRPVLRKTVLFFTSSSSSSSLQARTLLARLQASEFYSTSPPPPQPHSRRLEEQSRKFEAKNKHENPPRKEKKYAWIRNLWPFSKSSPNNSDSDSDSISNNVEDLKLSELDRILSKPKSPEPQHDVYVSHSELFSSDSFWKDVKSFVFTPSGSGLVSMSRSREDLAHKLQKHGPVALMSLSEKDILQLVELLIVEKKWLEQRPSREFPFTLITSVQKTSLLGQSHGAAANGLRSLFLNQTSQSQSNLQKSFEHDVEEKPCQSVHQTRVSEPPAAETKHTERSRSDVLVDCQKLVSEILRDHPGGYNIAGFQKLFDNRYGYQLDVKKLGYRNLTSLLQIMTGVKLESNYIFPSIHDDCASDSDNELSDSAPKEDSMESPWEELGSEDSKSSEPHRDVCHSGKPELFEDAKKMDQTASHFEEPKSSEPQQDDSHSGKLELFSSDSFWKDIKSFVFTPTGSGLVSLSRSREDLAHKLQKHGPVVLMSLSENDILQLVELLIVEKKWLEKSPSKAFPFMLARSVQKTSLLGQSQGGANGLRSLFLNETSQSNLQKSFENDVEKRCQSVHQTRVSKPATETKYTERSRSDILVDCQKLVSEILRDHPEGYNIGGFRKLFANRYGYQLDVMKLGYHKLASLLQIMPGVKLESNYIFPSIHAVCASDSDDEDSMESIWEEELGPVKDFGQNDLESKLAQNALELDTPKHPASASESESESESEGDSSYLTQPEEEQGKPKCNEQGSSFVEALDLWKSSKKGENRVKKSYEVNVSKISLHDIFNSSTDSTRGAISKTIAENHRETQRSKKNY